jgi:hypothetical protein
MNTKHSFLKLSNKIILIRNRKFWLPVSLKYAFHYLYGNQGGYE